MQVVGSTFSRAGSLDLDAPSHREAGSLADQAERLLELQRLYGHSLRTEDLSQAHSAQPAGLIQSQDDCWWRRE